MTDSKLITLLKAAEILGVSKGTIHRWIKAPGKDGVVLQTVKPGYERFTTSDFLTAFIEQAYIVPQTQAYSNSLSVLESLGADTTRARAAAVNL